MRDDSDRTYILMPRALSHITYRPQFYIVDPAVLHSMLRQNTNVFGVTSRQWELLLPITSIIAATSAACNGFIPRRYRFLSAENTPISIVETTYFLPPGSPPVVCSGSDGRHWRSTIRRI